MRLFDFRSLFLTSSTFFSFDNCGKRVRKERPKSKVAGAFPVEECGEVL
jgi:hypothetical protein